jgi:hypothetical protein
MTLELAMADFKATWSTKTNQGATLMSMHGWTDDQLVDQAQQGLHGQSVMPRPVIVLATKMLSIICATAHAQSMKPSAPDKMTSPDQAQKNARLQKTGRAEQHQDGRAREIRHGLHDGQEIARLI